MILMMIMMIQVKKKISLYLTCKIICFTLDDRDCKLYIYF